MLKKCRIVIDAEFDVDYFWEHETPESSLELFILHELDSAHLKMKTIEVTAAEVAAE